MGRAIVIVLFLPATPDAPWRWLRLEAGGIVAHGEGAPEGAPVVAIAPAAAVTLHWAELPDRSRAQALAAARLLVAEVSAAPPAELHVAVGAEGAAERPIAVVAVAEMAGWLVALAERGIDPEAVVPAPLLLPAPESGYVRGDPGGGPVVRGRGVAFADEADATPLVVGEGPLRDLPPEEVDAAIVAAVTRPALDLRQGVFARRRRRSIDWRLVRRLALLGAAILAIVLLTDLVRIVRYNAAAAQAEAEADRLVGPGVVGDSGDSAGRSLGERLERLRGPGLGFSRTVAAAVGAVQGAPSVEVTRLAFAADGSLRVGLLADGAPAIDAVRARLVADGFRVEAGAVSPDGQRMAAELTVRP